MVYASPVHADLASGRFYDERGRSFYCAPDKLESDFAPVRFARELKVFRRYCPRGTVLDVGCSTGAFLHQLRELGGYDVAGTDVTGDALDHAASRGIRVIRKSLLDPEFPSGPYDAVTFWAVLEHLVDPLAHVRRAADLLRPGGHLLVLVPNVASLAVRLCGARYRYVMPDHVNYFSARTLTALAARERRLQGRWLGFTHFNPVVIWQDWRGGLERVPDAERARLLRRTTAWKQRRGLGPMRWVYRASEALLARFGLADNVVLVLERANSGVAKGAGSN